MPESSGVVDAPLLFQVALLDYIKKCLNGDLSLYDENYANWVVQHRVKRFFVIHVDDILVFGLVEWRIWAKKTRRIVLGNETGLAPVRMEWY